MPLTWWLSREKAEETIVSMAMEEARGLMRQSPFELDGENTIMHANAAAQALVGGLFDIVEIYSAQGIKIAEALTATGKEIESTIDLHGPPRYTSASYESQYISDNKWVIRVFVPIFIKNNSNHSIIQGYIEGVRLIPDWQRSDIRNDAFQVAIMVALAALVCGGILFPVVMRLFAENQNKARELLESNIFMMEALGRTIAKRDSDTGTHNYRVAWIAARLGESVNLNAEQMQALILGSFLHDIGKIGIPDAILLKPGKLSDDEMSIMRTHVDLGEQIVSDAGWLERAQTVVGGHHEKWNGSGYPRGLTQTQIPLIARIFSVADVFDALCSKRPYKAPFTLNQSMAILKEGSGNHFDPDLVEVFSKIAPQIHAITSQSSEAEMIDLLHTTIKKHFYI